MVELMTIDIGLPEKNRKAVATALSAVLADTYTLYLKTHNFHWNVAGPNFYALHKQFEELYTELAQAVDEIAERIRALGHIAPGSYAAFAKLTQIKEAIGAPAAHDMIRQLTADNETLVRVARATKDLVETLGDAETGDMMIERMQVHAKAAWMLRVQLK
jgi:starvation-inducible DNA-binding protein